MSSITRLQDALLQLEDHLCKAGTALIRAEQDSEAADIERMLRAFGWRYKPQVTFLRDYGEAVQELGNSEVELAHDPAHQSHPADAGAIICQSVSGV